MRGLSVSQVINGFIGAALWWYFQKGVEVAGFWVAAFNVIVIVALMYAIGKTWRPLVRTIRSAATDRRPSPGDVVAWTRQWFQREKIYVITFLWVLTWTLGVMTPLFILIPHRGEFIMPAEALAIIVMVAVVPWAECPLPSRVW